MKKILLATAVIVAGFALSSAAFAQDAATPPTDVPGHPRVNEVDQRDQNQQNRINQGEADGQLTKHEAAHDQRELNHEEAQQQRQEAEHGGHLTKAEQHRDNRELNHSSRKIHRTRHNGRHRHHR